MPTQVDCVELVTVSARVCVDRILRIAWPNPVKPDSSSATSIVTERPGDTFRSLEFRLDRLTAICREFAIASGVCTIKTELMARPVDDQLPGHWRIGAQLHLTFQPTEEHPQQITQKDAEDAANRLIDALHNRM